jgi:hypothetical protein
METELVSTDRAHNNINVPFNTNERVTNNYDAENEMSESVNAMSNLINYEEDINIKLKEKCHNN